MGCAYFGHFAGGALGFSDLWFAGAKAAIAVIGIPDHRGAAAVAALEFRPELNAVGVLQVFEGNVRLGQTKLFALIQADRPTQAHQQRRIGLCGIVREVPAGCMAYGVMGGIGPARPRIGCGLCHAGKGGFQQARRQARGLQHLERVTHLHLVAARCVFGHDL